MLKTHKIALVQTSKRPSSLNIARVAYNYALADFKRIERKRLAFSDLCRRFSIKHEHTTGAQNASKNAIYNNLNNAISRWKSGQNRFPKFKKRSHGQSYQADSGRGTTTVVGRRIKFPKLVGSVCVNPYASTAQSVRWLYPRLHIVGSLLLS